MADNRSESGQLIAMERVEHLLLDAENPRLTLDNGGDQNALLVELYKRYHLDDLITSFAQNGYFSEEPLIGVENGRDEQGNTLYTIVEGNRRLAALKLLLFSDSRAVVEADGLPEISEDIKRKLNPVPVKIYESRSDIVPYLGVRHISGVRPWEAYAKARYIKSLVGQDYSMAEIKRMVGISRGDVVQRWLLTLYTLNQVNEIADSPWRPGEGYFKFSFLYTSLGYHRVRDFVGMSAEVYESPREHPIPRNFEGNLLDHMVDLYGKPGQPELRKVGESREIQQLAAVYATPEALSLLRSGYSLEDAYSRSIGEAEEMVALIREASYKLDKATGLAPHHRISPDGRKFAQRCMTSAEALVNILEDGS